MKIDPVLNEYRRGDADKRIGMCLYYREFRDGFSGIEQDDPMDLGTSLQSPPHRLVSTILQVLHNTKRHFFLLITIPTGRFNINRRLAVCTGTNAAKRSQKRSCDGGRKEGKK